MNHIKYVFLLFIGVLLIACSDSGKELKASDFVGEYKLAMTFETESDRARHAADTTDQTGLFIIGPSYIAFGNDRQQLDNIKVLTVAGEKNLVLTVADKDLNLKIIDNHTLVLKTGPAIGTFTRVK